VPSPTLSRRGFVLGALLACVPLHAAGRDLKAVPTTRANLPLFDRFLHFHRGFMPLRAFTDDGADDGETHMFPES
jgi:hypothetical protein